MTRVFVQHEYVDALHDEVVEEARELRGADTTEGRLAEAGRARWLRGAGLARAVLGRSQL